MNNLIKSILIATSVAFLSCAQALTYILPDNGDTVIGQAIETQSKPDDTLRIIGRRYDMGFKEMHNANPGIDPEKVLMPGTRIIIPSQFILPPGDRKGIVINLNAYRLYYYPPDTNMVITFPVGIGKVGWNTPTFDGTITKKAQNPSWYVPQSVKDYERTKGIELPNILPPGPKNPLGQFALYTSLPGYLLHGTNRPLGVGDQVSSGCLRMLPEDVEQLYHQVEPGTKIHVTHQPYEIGILNNDLYLEIHPKQEGLDDILTESTTPLMSLILFNSYRYNLEVDWDRVSQTLALKGSLPVHVSK